MAEPIKMPFGLMAPVGPRNHVLDGGTDAPIDRGHFEGEERPFERTKSKMLVVCMVLTFTFIFMTFGRYLLEK